MSSWNFVLSWVEHEQFYNFGARQPHNEEKTEHIQPQLYSSARWLLNRKYTMGQTTKQGIWTQHNTTKIG